MKGYKNRQATPAREDTEPEFFFPKHVPPTTIKARSPEEAERRLADLDKRKEV